MADELSDLRREVILLRRVVPAIKCSECIHCFSDGVFYRCRLLAIAINPNEICRAQKRRDIQ
ncbi:MAG: hypothetical protein RR058_07990 [Oscillospiraceae bacterium]